MSLKLRLIWQWRGGALVHVGRGPEFAKQFEAIIVLCLLVIASMDKESCAKDESVFFLHNSISPSKNKSNLYSNKNETFSIWK